MSVVRREDEVVTEPKYVVLRRDDFERITSAANDGSGRPGSAYYKLTLDPDTYFVLRDTDVLSHALLWNYVQLIQTLRELSRARPGMLSREEEESLTELEDFSQDLALAWQRRGKGRLPT